MIKKKFNKKILLIPIVVVISVLLALKFNTSQSAELASGTQVQDQTDLTYYLKVRYDGVDRYGIESNQEVKADIQSGYIYVEDIIPEGLIFNGFVKTEDGTIGAVQESSNEPCLGKVVDDSEGIENISSYHGLHYDESTRKVSFKINNLQAGCVLTVGIKTQTPALDDNTTEQEEARRDFYNFATTTEDNYYSQSNTIHAWMGIENNISKYSVSYEYSGTIPENPPELPSSTQYVVDALVVLNTDPKMSGYEFLGWTSEDVTITDNKFTMPEKNVVIKGEFKQVETYKVKYEISGEKPDNYELPKEKEYNSNDTIYVDSLKPGTIIGKYEFSGWTNKETGEKVSQKITMGNQDLTLVGSFKLKTYKLTYKFYDSILPPESSQYLPASTDLLPGTKISLPTINDVEGYEFVGWYIDNNVEMPEEDLIIYGEWKEEIEYFEPRVEMKPEKDNYSLTSGDTANYIVTIYNDKNYPIHDVYISNRNQNIKISIDEKDGSIVNESLVLINEIPANNSISYTLSYTATEEDYGKIKNEIELVSALEENNKALNTNKKYIASEDIPIKSSIKICNKIINTKKDDKTEFTYNIEGEGYQKEIKLSHNECEIMYVNPGQYKITQNNVEKYKIAEITEGIKSNGETIEIKDHSRININFVNEQIIANPFTKTDIVIIILIGVLALCFVISVYMIMDIYKHKDRVY